ncbi:MAG: hypothetical protein KA886_10355 [Candidatus Cloacimonetes bacterium]|nr:hypothetical protein [Candidatus Cloacimonadota bacterium]
MQKNKEIDKFFHNYQLFLNASKNHNIESCESAITYLEEQENTFWTNVLSFIENAKNEVDEIKTKYTDLNEYSEKLLSALVSRNIPAELNENKLTIGPLTIEILLEEFKIMLYMGRKKVKISDLELNKVVKFIELYYKKLNSSFNANAFTVRMIKAYEYLNRSIYCSKDTQFGNAVPLEDIFKIFTVSPVSSDYKLENFIWDLGRLISSEFDHPNYQIELGTSRKISRTMIIKDIEGNEHKYSTLTVYLKDKTTNE